MTLAPPVMRPGLIFTTRRTSTIRENLGGCVLAGGLRSRPLQASVRPLQSCLPGPRAPQVITDVETEYAQPRNLEVYPISVLNAAEPSVVGAGCNHVPGL